MSSFYEKFKEKIDNLLQFRDKLRQDFSSYKVIERFIRIWAVAFVVSGAYYKLTGDMSLFDAMKESALNGIYAGGMSCIDKLREFLPNKTKEPKVSCNVKVCKKKPRKNRK